MKHTQGEWYINSKAQKGSFHSIWAKGENESGRHNYGIALASGSHSEEAEANAKLIAAAPELLQALITLQKAYREAVKLHDPNTHDSFSAISHNAIAKAITG